MKKKIIVLAFILLNVSVLICQTEKVTLNYTNFKIIEDGVASLSFVSNKFGFIKSIKIKPSEELISIAKIANGFITIELRSEDEEGPQIGDNINSFNLFVPSEKEFTISDNYNISYGIKYTLVIRSNRELLTRITENANVIFGKLRDANLNSRNLKGVDFSFSDLRNIDLRNCDCKKAIFTGANLTSAVASTAFFNETNFRWANLTNAVVFFSNFTDSQLSNSELKNSNFGSTRLSRANFSGANIYMAGFSRANLIDVIGFNIDNIRLDTDVVQDLSHIEIQIANEGDILNSNSYLKENFTFINPIKNTLNIPDNVTRVSLYSLTGKKILNSTTKKTDVSNLSKGIYIAKFFTNKKNIITKQVIIE